MKKMNTNRRKKLFGRKQLFFLVLLLFIVFLSILIALVPEIVSTDFENWSRQYLGANYKPILIIGFIVATTILAYLTIDLSGFLPGHNKRNNYAIVIPWSEEYENLVQKAKRAIKQAELQQSIEYLSKIDAKELNEEVALLSSRLARHERDRRTGIHSMDSTATSLNRLSQDILNLIEVVEKSLKKEEKINSKIKTHLIQRYESRLRQKLAGRQPFNLNKSSTSEGTSEETSSYFVTLSSKEVQQEIKSIFREAQGRLLITGEPGAGKTVVMLQLVLALLKEESHAIPVLLNLATWDRNFSKLEDWLEEVLQAEMSVNSILAKKVLSEIPLILLLDGLDEVDEKDRKSCLEAVGRYGAKEQRQFSISTRKQEYNEMRKDAPVFMQVEIKPLKIDQVKEELRKVSYQQPGALALLKAIEKDSTLGKTVTTPFYFNVLQLLFDQGKRLSEFNFKSDNIPEYQKEIIETFTSAQLKPVNSKVSNYQVQHWLRYLAFQMNTQKLTAFELTDLQYSWSTWTKNQKRMAKLLMGLVAGILSGFIFGLAFGPVGGLIYGLTEGIGSGLPVLLLGALTGIVGGGILGGLAGSLTGGVLGGLFLGLGDGLHYLIFGAIIFGTTFGFSEGLVAGSIFMILFAIIEGRLKGFAANLTSAITYILTGALLGVFFRETLTGELIDVKGLIIMGGFFGFLIFISRFWFKHMDIGSWLIENFKDLGISQSIFEVKINRVRDKKAGHPLCRHFPEADFAL